jgi:hypothetical protein
MQRHLPTAYPAKAALPLSSSSNWLHSCRLSIAEKHEANNQQEQSKALLTVQYEIHKSAQPMLPSNSVALCLKMVQRDVEKWSWITSGGHTLIGIDWHPFGVLEADDYRQNYHWQSIDIYKLYIHEEK